MAKRDLANLAGLAALGALGYKMLKDRDKGKGGGDESVFTGPMQSGVESEQRERAIAEGLKAEGPESVGSSMRDAQDMSGIDYSAGVSRRAPRTAPRPAPRTVTPPTSVVDTGDEVSRLAARYPARNLPALSRAERLAEEAKRPLAERQAEQLEYARNIPLFRGVRAVGNELTTADKRYFQGKLDRGEPLNETEKAQARRAGLTGFKKGGAVKAKKMSSGGATRSSASKRADGIATKGKTRGKFY